MLEILFYRYKPKTASARIESATIEVEMGQHDQNFKNLILDYPREALAFFAPEEGAGIPPDATITPIREEQLTERLGAR